MTNREISTSYKLFGLIKDITTYMYEEIDTNYASITTKYRYLPFGIKYLKFKSEYNNAIFKNKKVNGYVHKKRAKVAKATN